MSKRENSLMADVLTYFKRHPYRVINLADLLLLRPVATELQMLNAIYGLRRKDNPIQVVVARAAFRYEPGNKIKRDFGHGYSGTTLRVLHKGKGRWICIDHEGRTWFAYRVQPDE